MHHFDVSGHIFTLFYSLYPHSPTNSNTIYLLSVGTCSSGDNTQVNDNYIQQASFGIRTGHTRVDISPRIKV